MTTRTTGTILIVDDNPRDRFFLTTLLEKAHHTVHAAASATEALDVYAARRPDLCITDLTMPEMDGLALLAELRRRDPHAQVIVVTAYGSISQAVAAMRSGALDFLTKPMRRDELLARIDKALALNALVTENIHLRAEVSDKYDFSKLVVASSQMREVVSLAEKAARRDVTVMITGESGVGKEVLARAIHYNSRNQSGPFFALNCAAIPDGLIESELFGHEKGAFSGADQRKEGLIEQAAKGTLLLDEVGDMLLRVQAKLLRVIERREFIRVGGIKPIPVEARLIAATNTNLAGLIQQGQFREDLYFRLNVFAIHIPPLRDRRDDILALANHFLNRLARETGRGLMGFSQDAIEHMLNAPWRGNVRELANAIERASIVSGESLITARHFPPTQPTALPRAGVSSQTTAFDEVERTVHEIERAALLHALEKSGNNLSRAARLLGIGRGAFRYRLEKLGDPEAPVPRRTGSSAA